jgi:hypothetical protein
MRVPVTIDIPEKYAGSVVWMAEMAGLSSGEVVQRIVNFIGANIRSGNDLGHVLSGPAAVFELFPEVENRHGTALTIVMKSMAGNGAAFDFANLMRKA